MPLFLRQIRWQIAVAYTLLIMIVLATLALVLYDLTRRTYLRTLEAGIVGQAYLIAELAETIPPLAGGANLDALDILADRLGQQLGARVTLVGPDGRMLADSILPLARYATRVDRPEVEAALRSGLGETQRYSTTTGDDRYYVAVPFERNGALAGVVRLGVPLPTITATQAQIELAVLATALVAVAVTIVLAVLIARRTTRPLLELRTMAERLSNGDLDVRAPVPKGEEVGALAQSFNQMAQRLRQLIDDQIEQRERLATILSTMHDGILILDANGSVTMANRAAGELLAFHSAVPFPIANLALGAEIRATADATHGTSGPGISRLIEELSPPSTGRSLRVVVTHLGDYRETQTLVTLQDLTELRRADRSQRMLLTNIAHDLRTPVASLQALIDTLHDGALEDHVVARDFLNRMHIEVQGLSQLVEDFLTLSRIELGQMTPQRAPTDLLELLRSVAERMRAQARQRGVALVLDLAEPLPIIELDRRQIELVLLNLLQNGLSFTPAGGQVSVRAHCAGGEMIVTVADTGVGITADALPHIFERFYKADPSRSLGGVGLGLSIAKGLVEQHSGRIWATSTSQGTAISFALPAPTR